MHSLGDPTGQRAVRGKFCRLGFAARAAASAKSSSFFCFVFSIAKAFCFCFSYDPSSRSGLQADAP